MGRSIDAIWREHVAKKLDCEVPDIELSSYVDQLKTIRADLAKTRELQQWQAHYEAALSVCRLSRRIRFRMAELESGEFDFRSVIHPLLEDTYKQIATDAEAKDVTYTVKKLSHIRENVLHRIESIEEDQVPALDD